jgi:hypothetical protein
MAKSKEIKKNDGRAYNKRLVPKPISTVDKIIAPKTTKAKRDRVESYAIAAMKEEFGSEREFFKFLAKKARESYTYMKLFMEYGYGKVADNIDSEKRTSGKAAPQITFINNQPQPIDNTIDITHDEEE